MNCKIKLYHQTNFLKIVSMKRIFLTSLFLLLFTTINSQKTASGYYMNQSNDTIAAEIKIGKGVFGQMSTNFTDEVYIKDSLNNFKKFSPSDIKSYGFEYEGKKYIFFSKPTKKGENKFLVPMYLGNKGSLYQYGNFIAGNGYALPSQQVFYTFEKPNEEYLFLRNILNKKFKIQIKEFYSEHLETQELIDKKLQYWLDLNKDLIEIMQSINK